MMLAQKLRLTLLEPIGKYWIFKMHYHQAVSKQLLAVKGVYWNASYKCYMALRHPDVKENVEHILEKGTFFGTDYLSKDKTVGSAQIEIKTHPEDRAWMEVFVPKMVLVHEKIKRFKMVRYSVSKNCYLVPAAPEALQANPTAQEALEVMRTAIKKTGLEKKATVHTLRHSFATHLLEAGIDIRYNQDFLGYSGIKTTLIYTHLTKGAVDKIQSPLDRMVDENNKKSIE